MFRRKRPNAPDLLPQAVAGVACAAAVWPAVFRHTRGNFWARMTLASGALGLYALYVRPDLRRQRPEPRDVIPGLASAVGLYAVFQVGDRMARRIMPAGEQDIEDVYRLRTLAPKPLIAALLVTVIAPSEEWFWRGLVQHAFAQRLGPFKGALAGMAAYGGVHFGSGNLTLTGAATVAGGYWGMQYAAVPRLGPLLVSHILWDVWIFLVQPTPTGREKK
ncbi:MAG: hypothetical protein NVS2B16_01180 [Chloroflexota bacterium]